MRLLNALSDIVRGKEITIPALDGAYRPNEALEDARLVADLENPIDVASIAGDEYLVAAGHQIYRGSTVSGELVALDIFDSEITALSVLPTGVTIVGLDDGRLFKRSGEAPWEPIFVPGLSCPTSIEPYSAGKILVTQGSDKFRPTEWRHDFLERASVGALWAVDVALGTGRKLAQELAYPTGVVFDAKNNRAIVSECWNNRLVQISTECGKPKPVLVDLPGYPGRLRSCSRGGYWLALWAPRNRLVEFVLTEKKLRRGLLQEVPPEYWITPAFGRPKNFLEPLQCGSVRTMGVSKPWAPTRSYGLLVRIDDTLRPISSFHSRANGQRHGIVSMTEAKNELLVISKGAGSILGVEVSI